MIRRDWLKGLLAGVGYFPSMRWANASSIVFKAEGIGKNLKEAQAHALAALSQQILSEVSVEVSQAVETKGEEVSKQAKVSRSLKSHLLLKGVQFQPEGRLPSGEVKVLALMDVKAVAQTIQYLQQATEFQPESLKLSDIGPLQKKVRMLQAILLALPASLRAKFQQDFVRAQKKSEWLRKRLTQALWVINFQGKPARVWIDGKEIKIGDPIFLTPGRHDYHIKSRGYKSVEGVLQVRAGERLVQAIDWILERAGIPVSLQVSPQLNFIADEQWQDWLTSLGLVWQPHAETVLRVTMRDQVSQVENFERHHLALSMAFYRGQRRLKRLRTRFEVTTFQGDTLRVKKAIIQKIEQALKVLVSKTYLEGKK